MHFQQKAQKVKFIVIYILFSNNNNKKNACWNIPTSF